MNKVIHYCVFAVTQFNQSYLIKEYTKEEQGFCLDDMDDLNEEMSTWIYNHEDIPKEVGIYACNIEIVSDQSYHVAEYDYNICINNVKKLLL